MAIRQRIVRLAARAAQASTPLEALRVADELRRQLDIFERQQVSRALAEGVTFAQIARHLGVSRQAAHRRFRSLAGGHQPLVMTDDARRVLSSAREEATALGADAPGSEHVLLATLRAVDLPAAEVLLTAGANLERARGLAEAARRRAPVFRRETPTGDLRELLATAAYEARHRGGDRVAPEHLLLGALDDDAGPATRMLRALGVDIEAVRTRLDALLSSQPVTPRGSE